MDETTNRADNSSPSPFLGSWTLSARAVVSQRNTTSRVSSEARKDCPDPEGAAAHHATRAGNILPARILCRQAVFVFIKA